MMRQLTVYWITALLTGIFCDHPTKVTQLTNLKFEEKPCYYRSAEIRNDSLKKKLERYIARIENDALPLLAIETHNDTSLIYLSATISANSIRNSPPSYIMTISGRDVAVFTGSEALINNSGECINTLVEKLRKVLNIDKVNEKNGLSPGAIQHYGYEAIWVKITCANNKIVAVNDTGQALRSIPYFKFSF